MGKRNNHKNLTLSEWMMVWLDDYSLSKKYGTIKAYKSQIRTNLNPFIGDVKLQSLSAERINRFYKLLSEGTAEKRH